MLRIFYFLSMFILVSFATYAGPEIIYKAHESYDKGNYEDAIKKYDEYFNKNIESGAAFFNLGNFHFRNQELGKAIFNYKKALELIPRDADLKFNLNYARAKTVDKLEIPPMGLWGIISLNNIFSFKESCYLIVIFASLFWIVSIIFIFKKSEWVKWTQRGLMIVFVLLLLVGIKDHLQHSRFGVISANKVQVFSAIGKDNVVLFTLNEGTEFDLKDQVKDKWLQIVLADGKKGWILADKAVF